MYTCKANASDPPTQEKCLIFFTKNIYISEWEILKNIIWKPTWQKISTQMLTTELSPGMKMFLFLAKKLKDDGDDDDNDDDDGDDDE